MNFQGRAIKHQAVEKLEHKALPLKVDDLSKDSRTAVIAHATYDNIDRVGDICRPGMFNKSWQENKADIKFYMDHDPGQKPGSVLDVWESKSQAFTKVKFGNWTLGNDALEMLDSGVIDGASFGFKAIKAPTLEIKGKKVRELKEVYHGETTLTNALPPINPLSKVVLVNKAGEPLFFELKARLDKLEKFCRNTTASDECIKHFLLEIKALNKLISQDDTADTHDDEPDASDSDEMDEGMESTILTQIKLIHAKTSLS